MFFSYVWVETEAPKSVISSAVHNTLKNTAFLVLATALRLLWVVELEFNNDDDDDVVNPFVDESSARQSQSITVRFTVVSHLFLPLDRVFGMKNEKFEEANS